MARGKSSQRNVQSAMGRAPLSFPKMSIFLSLQVSDLDSKLNEICRNHIKAGFFNVIIQDIAVHRPNDSK